MILFVLNENQSDFNDLDARENSADKRFRLVFPTQYVF